MSLDVYAQGFDARDHSSRDLDTARLREGLNGHYTRTQDRLYAVNHSLGTAPVRTFNSDRYELMKRRLGVAGHFEQAPDGGWYRADEEVRESVRKLFGAANVDEVAVPGGGLSDNLDRFLEIAYRPDRDAQRPVLLGLGSDFYSDVSLLHSAVAREHNHRERLGGAELSREALHLIQPGEDGVTVTEQDIINAVQTIGDRLQTVLVPEVHFITGRRIDTNRIAREVHRVGGNIIVDAAHAVGNVAMHYSNYGPDYAAGCTYKLLAADPGNEAIVYVNSRNFEEVAGDMTGKGWFSFHHEDRFIRPGEKERRLAPGASVLRRSNTNMASFVALQDALAVFDKVGIDKVEYWGRLMVDYCLGKLSPILNSGRFKLLTPLGTNQSGCMLTFAVEESMVEALKEVFEREKVHVDWRDPNILRISFHPLHNTFRDIDSFVDLINRSNEK